MLFFLFFKELLFHKLKGEITMNSSSINKWWISAMEREFEKQNTCQFKDVESKREPPLEVFQIYR